MNATSLDLFTAAENAAIVGDIMTRVMLTCELGSITRAALDIERIGWYERADRLLKASLAPRRPVIETLAYNI